MIKNKINASISKLNNILQYIEIKLATLLDEQETRDDVFFIIPFSTLDNSHQRLKKRIGKKAYKEISQTLKPVVKFYQQYTMSNAYSELYCKGWHSLHSNESTHALLPWPVFKYQGTDVVMPFNSVQQGVIDLSQTQSGFSLYQCRNQLMLCYQHWLIPYLEARVGLENINTHYYSHTWMNNYIKKLVEVIVIFNCLCDVHRSQSVSGLSSKTTLSNKTIIKSIIEGINQLLLQCVYGKFNVNHYVHNISRTDLVDYYRLLKDCIIQGAFEVGQKKQTVDKQVEKTTKKELSITIHECIKTVFNKLSSVPIYKEKMRNLSSSLIFFQKLNHFTNSLHDVVFCPQMVVGKLPVNVVVKNSKYYEICHYMQLGINECMIINKLFSNDGAYGNTSFNGVTSEKGIHAEYYELKQVVDNFKVNVFQLFQLNATVSLQTHSLSELVPPRLENTHIDITECSDHLDVIEPTINTTSKTNSPPNPDETNVEDSADQISIDIDVTAEQTEMPGVDSVFEKELSLDAEDDLEVDENDIFYLPDELHNETDESINTISKEAFDKELRSLEELLKEAEMDDD
ncbi:hypothetical protein [Zooshikella sp. RANM57]|uniref:hypothetical protein n=1 Tax=Zooshikella sp. RANM57 TaxID=3425863 RepID=UPI003D701F75